MAREKKIEGLLSPARSRPNWRSTQTPGQTLYYEDLVTGPANGRARHARLALGTSVAFSSLNSALSNRAARGGFCPRKTSEVAAEKDCGFGKPASPFGAGPVGSRAAAAPACSGGLVRRSKSSCCTLRSGRNPPIGSSKTDLFGGSCMSVTEVENDRPHGRRAPDGSLGLRKKLISSDGRLLYNRAVSLPLVASNKTHRFSAPRPKSLPPLAKPR